MSNAQISLKSYRAGDWFGIFGEGATVLLPSSEKARVAALWELVDDGADFGEVLDALIASGLRDLPGFVLVSAAEGTTRVVLRGPVVASFTTGGGEVVDVDGSQASTWVERSIPDVARMVVNLTEEDAEAESFTIGGGLVRVGWVTEPAEAPVAEVAAEQPLEESADASDAPVAAGSSAAPVVLPVPDAEGTPDAAADEAPIEDAAVEDADVQEVAADAPEEAPEAPADEAPADDAPVDETPVEEATTEEFAADAPEEAPEAPVDEAAAEPVAEPVWGAPESDPVVPAEPAVEPQWGAPQGEPAAAAWAPDAPAPDAGSVWAPPVEPVQAVEPAQPVEQSVDAIWGPPPGDQAPVEAAAPDAPAELPTDEDHDGMTRAGAWDPEQFARPQAGIPGQPPAPSVTARPVALLNVSNGEVVEVDRAILIGRAPEARRFSSTDQPRLLTVPSPNQEISSTHLEVRPGSGVDHGTAIVTDMGSTNGTVLVQPGLPPEDLQPGIPVQLIPGAVIDLGDGVTITVTNP